MLPFPSTAVRHAIVLLLAAVASGAHPSADVTARLAMRASISTRTRLTVSTRDLQFHLAAGDTAASASVTFRAAARTSPGGEVVLTVEPERWIDGPAGSSDLEAHVSFDGDGEGTLAGWLLPRSVSVAGRWVGSGDRVGSLRFTLRTTSPGTYGLPLRFVLSAP